LVKPGDLLSQDVDDCIRRIAGFEPAKEWIRYEVVPSFPFIGFQSIVKDGLIVLARRGLRKIVGHSGDVGGPGMMQQEWSLGVGDEGLSLMFGLPVRAWASWILDMDG
jgi:hypothetical protein